MCQWSAAARQAGREWRRRRPLARKTGPRKSEGERTALRMTEAPSGHLEARIGGSGAAAADDSVAATGHEAAKTTAGTVPRFPATTAGSGTVIRTTDTQAEDRKAAAAVVTAGGSTAAAWAAGTTHTESWILPTSYCVEPKYQFSCDFF